MLRMFLKEYNEWKREHRQEVQEAALRKEAMKTPLNYQILDKMFQTWVKDSAPGIVMRIKGADFVTEWFYDNNNQFRRITTTERILANS